MTFPNVPQNIDINFFINGAWEDVTNLRPTYNCYVLGTSGSSDTPAVTIRRIKKSGLPIVGKEFSFTFFDPDAVMDNDNPLSPYYGLIPPGTNVRVVIDGIVRVVGAIDSTEPDFTDAPEIVTLLVTCVGVWDGLARGQQKPLNSPIHRSTIPANPVEYWRLEEGAGSTTFRSALPAGPDCVLTGSLSFAADTELGGSLPNPVMGTDTLAQFPIRTHTFNGHWQVDWFMHMEGERAVDTTVMRVLCLDGPIYYWDFIVGNNTHYVRAFDINGAVVFTSASFATPSFMVTGWSHYRLMVHDIGGGTTEWRLVEFPVPTTTGAFFAGTYSGSIGRPIMAQFLSPLYQANPAATLEGMSYGHLAVYDNYDFSAVDGSGSGYTGERAASRFARIGAEEGITIGLVGSVNDTVIMGPQPADTTLNILLECAIADSAIMYDTMTAQQLIFRTRLNMYTQAAQLQLSYSQSHLSDPFYPVTGGVSDTTILNNITAERPKGGTAQYVIPDNDYNHWTTQDPPLGVTNREGKITVNLDNDSLLNEAAAWAAHLASWKEKRFSQITVERHRAPVAAAVTASQLWALNIMTLIAVDTVGASRWLPQNEARMLVESRTDKLAQFGHTVIFNTRPADPYEVAQVNTSGSTLITAMTTSTTSIKVSTSSGPPWSEDDEPYHWQIDGEAMRVTAITSDTPVFIAAGTVSHASNASVTPGLPAGMTPDVGQLMVCMAAIRNAGAGFPTAPAGWVTLSAGVAATQNVQFFGRYYITGDTAPTITFTGGVANASCSARIVAYSGLSMVTDATTAQANGSAQNIAIPVLSPYPSANGHRRRNDVVFLWGWKQDDWTSQGGIGGFTTVIDDTTVLGDDQGMVLVHRIDTTATATPAGAFTITGGVPAISVSGAIALRPLQTATVVRNVNNVNVTHATGAVIRGWRMGINGL